MSRTLPYVSVIIPCRNERNRIQPCLDSVLANDYPRDRLEIIVVDGMSDDGTAELVARYAADHVGVRLLTNPRRIVPAALNSAIAVARGDIIMPMGAHAEYPPDYISGLVGWIERTAVDNVGAACITRPANDTATARAIACALSHPFGVGNARFRLGTSEPRRVDTVPFGCYRRDVFRRVGLFDEDLVRNQDDEFNLRLIRAGGSVLLVPGMVASYYARATVRQLARMYYQYGYFKPLVIRKLRAVMTVRQLVPACLVVALLVAGFLSLVLAPARLALLVIGAGYLTASVVAAAGAMLTHGHRVAGLLPLVFAVLHLSYGLGFLQGLVAFFLLRRRAPHTLELSR